MKEWDVRIRMGAHLGPLGPNTDICMCERASLTCWNPQIQVQGTTARRLLHWPWFFSNSIAQKRPHMVTSGLTCRCFPRLAMWLAGWVGISRGARGL